MAAEIMRLDKYLCEALGITRSEVKPLVAKGRVTVDGQICKKADLKVNPAQVILVDGKPTSYQQNVYIMLDKPQGIVSAATDARDTTVVDLVKDAYPRRQLFPAGRLDKDSTGFVLLTDDGNFAHDLLAPRRHVSKTYLVGIDTPLTQRMIDGFVAGVTLADGTELAPAGLQGIPGDPYMTRVELTQGVYHQIKRMFGVFGAGVVSLRRVAMGGLMLDSTLGAGGWREITPEELRLLRPNGKSESTDGQTK